MTDAGHSPLLILGMHRNGTPDRPGFPASSVSLPRMSWLVRGKALPGNGLGTFPSPIFHMQ